jgi:5-methyltetrahydrofolate--homocysteine methyltransferase
MTDKKGSIMFDCGILKTAMKAGKVADVRKLVEVALAEGVSAQVILNKGLLEAMGEVGQRFKKNEVFVPEVLVAARAMKAGTELLKPHLVKAGVHSVATAVMGTVKGDLHDIGKNLVASMLEGGGFDVIDLGADVPPEKFIEAVKDKGAQVVCLSALLTVTMPAMKTTIEALKAAGVRDSIKILVGGAPVTAQYATEIGADGFGENANSAVALTRKMLGAGN